MRLCLLVRGLVACAACARPTPQAAEPPVVTITATDYAFAAPDTIPAGLITLRLVNQGKELHHASLVRLGEGKSSFVGGPNTVTVGDTAQATQVLEPGSYVFVCWIPSADGTPHIMKGMMRALAVVGPGRVAAEPAADVVVKLTDYDFQFSQPLTAGRHTIRVESAGLQAHEIAIAALTPGKTLQDFIAWEQGGEKGPLPTGRWLVGVSTIDAGQHAHFTASFAPGSYLLLCFWPDAKDGKPHLMHGMAKQITVS
jgi:uncharacterized cupredoxin-like copper-binding protein